MPTPSCGLKCSARLSTRHALALLACAGLASSILSSAALAQTAPGSRPDAPPPGKPEAPKPDFVMPEPNRVENPTEAAVKKAESDAKPAPAPSNGKPVMESDPEAPAYLVGAIVIKYGLDHPSLPSIDDLVKREVTLGRTDAGYVSPGGNVEKETISIEEVSLRAPQRWSSRAIFEVSKALLDEMNQRGIIGVVVTPIETEFAPPGENDPAWGKDVRKPGQTAITLLIKVALVGELRTLAFGDRIPFERRVNAEEHAKILDFSPVQIFHPDDEERLDIIEKDVLDDYVFRLNRHPGRRVDLAIAAAAEPDKLALDFLVNENKPWLLYFQVSNTGTKTTNEWRERFGYQNNQLTGADDILSIDYVTAGFDASHAVSLSYERPLWGDVIKGRVFGSYNQFTASDVGFAGEEFEGDGFTFGGELVANLYQYRELFLDAYAGLRYQNVSVNNKAVGIEGEESFLLPNFGLRVERSTQTATTSASIGLEFNSGDIIGTDRTEIEKLGRLQVDENWTVFQWDATHAFYLDPIIFGESWNDTSPSGNATLAHEVLLAFRGQHAFDNRLVPNFEQVLGGAYTVRGYPESIVAGDTVILGSAEYRLHIPQALGYDSEPGKLFGETFRYTPQQPYGRADWDLIAKGFVDAGKAINSNRQSFESDESLLGAGFGFEFSYKRYLNIRTDFGWALDEIDGQVKSGASRVHFVATLLF